MLSDEVLDKVIERLANRIEQGNEYVLAKIGSKIDEIGKLTPTNAIQLEQIMKYGGDYEKIVNKLAKITKLNKKDIEKIFAEVAKKDYKFAEQFYKYRNKKYLPYAKNTALKNQVDAIAKLTNDKYTELARTKALGFSIRDEKGRVIHKGLRETYNEAIDKAILSVSQGKTTFQEEMYGLLKEIGSSGIKTLDFGGRSMRLDSAIRMHVKGFIKQMRQEVALELGKQFDADGVEITVHPNPAPDHESSQGRQFSNDEWNKLQAGEDALDYKGVEHTLDIDHKNGYRQIGEYNCKHDAFPIILGVSQPEYTDEQLQKIIDDNHKGFIFEGKHYTNYEGTQLQRKIETEIRKQKDLQIIGRTGGNDKLAQESQIKINQLTKKYNELSKVSGLEKFTDRMRVSGYRPIKVKDITIDTPKDASTNNYNFFISKQAQTRRINFRKEMIQGKIYQAQDKINSVPKDTTNRWEIDRLEVWEKDLIKYQKQLKALDVDVKDKTIILNTREDCIDLLNEVNIKLNTKNLEQIDLDVLKANTQQYYDLCNKYSFLEQTLQEQELKLSFTKLEPGIIGEADRGGFNISLDIANFNNKEDALFWGKSQTSNGYNMPCAEDYYLKYFASHEMGHTFDYRIIQNVDLEQFEDLGARELYEKTNDYIIDNIYKIASKNTGKSKDELTNLLSSYGKTNKEETLAEIFANANCGKPNALGVAFDEFIKEWLG